MGQSVHPEPGLGRTALYPPFQSFSELARQVRAKEQDGLHSVVPRRPPRLLLFAAFPSHPAPPSVVHEPARGTTGLENSCRQEA